MFEWNEKLSVKNQVLDSQHQRMIGMLNELAEAAAQGQGQELVDKITAEMEAYAKLHFYDEERLLSRHNYSGLEEQKAAHQHFFSKTQAFKEEHAKGNIVVSVKILNYLTEWFFRHIKQNDQKFADFLASKGHK